MALPFDQILREQRFTQDHPEWAIHAQDGATRFTADSLAALLDHLEWIHAT